jgi:hypothetical protein
MMKNKGLFLILFTLALAVGAQADISLEEAIKMGKENIRKMMDQSYHYRIEYDTIICLPVHSKIIWKDDFYLLYFLKDDYFKAEMEINKKTGSAAVLALGKMSPPYHQLNTGIFNHKYFNVDSVKHHAFRRQQLEQDSARLVYFGVTAKLGKRGVIWENFSADGISYISLGGATLTIRQLIKGMHSSQKSKGNYIADSIKYMELETEINRLKNLTSDQLDELDITETRLDSLINANVDKQNLLRRRFPRLVKLSQKDDKPEKK